MSPLDRIIAYFSPVRGLRRAHARHVLSAYEAAKPGRLRKFHKDTGSANNDVQSGAVPLRVQARHLEQNHDLARGALRVLVNNIVGPGGIGIEPQPRRADGSIHEDYAAALREAWRDWCKLPEVTGRHHWAKAQRLVCRTWLRDGEAFAQTLAGKVPYLEHGTRVPYSLELMEPDLIPLHHYDDAKRIRQGVELNAWGRPTAYWAHKHHPGEWTVGASLGSLKRIPAASMLHLASMDRLHQVRGVSEFASVITRLEDIKDYEESERVAAKIAAMLTGYIKKGSPDLFRPDDQATDEDGNVIPREISFAPLQPAWVGATAASPATTTAPTRRNGRRWSNSGCITPCSPMTSWGSSCSPSGSSSWPWPTSPVSSPDRRMSCKAARTTPCSSARACPGSIRSRKPTPGTSWCRTDLPARWRSCASAASIHAM